VQLNLAAALPRRWLRVLLAAVGALRHHQHHWHCGHYLLWLLQVHGREWLLLVVSQVALHHQRQHLHPPPLLLLLLLLLMVMRAGTGGPWCCGPLWHCLLHPPLLLLLQLTALHWCCHCC
jgi:hypothetical protein